MIAVIGAGCSGLAAVKALRDAGLPVQCFERGSDVGGNWRYDNDSGLSSAYASLRTNVSRERMQFPSFPMPRSFGTFPHHSRLAAYLSDYADRFRLREHIAFRATVRCGEPDEGGGWRLAFDGGETIEYAAVVVATGMHWSPRRPRHPGTFAGTTMHSHDYRTPGPFAGRRVLVVGAGQSAAEIAVEVAAVARRTCVSARSGVHVIPRWIGGRPYDARDRTPFNRAPWPLLNLVVGRSAARELGPRPPSWPVPSGRVLEGNPVVSSDLFPAVKSGRVGVKPAIDALAGETVRFVDGSTERFDSIIQATGYEITLPFISPRLLSPRGPTLPLYRRIVAPGVPDLFFAGFVDAPGGLLPVVEAQGQWIAAALGRRIGLPALPAMWRAIDRAERRTRRRFPADRPGSGRCDPHAYRRVLRSDLRRARRGAAA